jgi:hypothetical protein
MEEIFINQDLLFSHFPEGEIETSSLTLSQFQAIQSSQTPSRSVPPSRTQVVHPWVHTSQQTFLSGEIIGGHKAKPHSRPYMAYLRILNNGFWRTCGGFLIKEDFVMTAAHCSGR